MKRCKKSSLFASSGQETLITSLFLILAIVLIVAGFVTGGEA